MYVRVPVPDPDPELPTSLKSRRPIPSVTVTKTVPPEEATSHLRPTWYTRGSGCHPERGAMGIQRRNSLPPKTRRWPPAEKKISSSRRELPALLLFPGDLSPPSLIMRHFSSTSMPLLARPSLLIPADLGSALWVPTSAYSARQASTRGLMQLHLHPPCLLGSPRPSQLADCDALSRVNPWASWSAIPSWNGENFKA